MYTNSRQSQHLFPQKPHIPQYPSLNDSYNKKIDIRFTTQRRGDGNKILEYLLNLRNCDEIHPSNATIATAVGCCERTVTRWTNRFVAEGLITKKQLSEYGVNYYTINISRKDSYQIYLDSLSPDNITTLINHGLTVNSKGEQSFLYETVIPNRDYIYINTNLVLCKSGTGQIQNKKREKALESWFTDQLYSRVKRGITMLQEEQKRFIQMNKRQPSMKEILSKDPVKSELFTPAYRKIKELLELTDHEALKMICFDDGVLGAVYKELQDVKIGKRAKLDDKVAWLYYRLNFLAAKANLKPHWKFYYDVCEILGIERLDNSLSHESRPFGIERTARDKTSHPVSKSTRDKPSQLAQRANGSGKFGQHVNAKPKEWEQTERTQEFHRLQNDIDHLKSQIAFNEMCLANPDKYIKYARQETIHMMTIEIIRWEEKIAEAQKRM